jgi:hypothetical protein
MKGIDEWLKFNKLMDEWMKLFTKGCFLLWAFMYPFRGYEQLLCYPYINKSAYIYCMFHCFY